MAFVSEIKGFDKVMANLNREIQLIKGRSMKGLIMAAKLIRDDTEKTPPLTPLDLGNLRASWFVVTAKSIPVGKSGNFEGEKSGNFEGEKSGNFEGEKSGKMATEHISTIAEAQGMAAASTKEMPFLIMGYSANYALWVHEMIHATFNPPRKDESKGKRRREGAGPKWFEASVKRNKDKVLRVIKDNAQIKG